MNVNNTFVVYVFLFPDCLCCLLYARYLLYPINLPTIIIKKKMKEVIHCGCSDDVMMLAKKYEKEFSFSLDFFVYKIIFYS